jgi:OmpA-OmpF porin, OOP family
LKKKQTISLDIQFDFDKAVIKPEYNNRLKEVGDFMTTYPETKAVIEGHTDSVGGAAYNMKLSQRRANSVRDYLIKNLNIKADRLEAKGFGKTQPVASNDTAEGRSKNRRIQAVMTAEKETYEKR